MFADLRSASPKALFRPGPSPRDSRLALAASYSLGSQPCRIMSRSIADPVDAEFVGAAGGSWRAAGHNDHHVALVAPPDVQQRRLDLADHVVGVCHLRDHERL